MLHFAPSVSPNTPRAVEGGILLFSEASGSQLRPVLLSVGSVEQPPVRISVCFNLFLDFLPTPGNDPFAVLALRFLVVGEPFAARRDVPR